MKRVYTAISADLPAIARACGYVRAESVETPEALRRALQSLTGPMLIEVRIRPGARADLGRPTTTPLENKRAFMQFLARPAALR